MGSFSSLLLKKSKVKLDELTSASEPNDQNEIERASGLSAIDINKPVTEVKMADVAIPTMTS